MITTQLMFDCLLVIVTKIYYGYLHATGVLTLHTSVVPFHFMAALISSQMLSDDKCNSMMI